MNNKIIIDVVSGAESKSLVINETRVAGNKAWGGGTIVESFNTTKDRVLGALNIELPQWIPCSERLPEERESVFKKIKGTSKWCEAMFEGISDDVNVTVEFEDGTRTTKVSHTLDGKWKCEKDYGIKMKVIAWQPLPEPYKEGDT